MVGRSVGLIIPTNLVAQAFRAKVGANFFQDRGTMPGDFAKIRGFRDCANMHVLSGRQLGRLATAAQFLGRNHIVSLAGLMLCKL